MTTAGEVITYRRAIGSDLDLLVDMRIRFLSEISPHGQEMDTAMVRERLRTYFAQALEGGDFVAWLAEIREIVVATSGMVLWNIPPQSSRPRSGRLGYVLNFYTVPDARKRGIAGELMKRIIDDARAAGLDRMQLHATADGIHVYRRAGFSEPELPVLELTLEHPDAA